MHRRPFSFLWQVSLLEKGDEITASEAFGLREAALRAAFSAQKGDMQPEVPEAAQLQASRSQELRSALIRGGSMQLQPQVAPARLLQRGEEYLRPVDLPFCPKIRKVAAVEVRVLRLAASS